MYSIRKSGMMIEIGEYSWRHCGDATRMKYCETPQDIQDLLMRMSPVEIAAAIHALFVAKTFSTDPIELTPMFSMLAFWWF